MTPTVPKHGMTIEADAAGRHIKVLSVAWAKKPLTYVCSVTQGIDSLLFVEAAISSTKPPNVFFPGECYNCGGLGHSQNYCPLTYCLLCSEYGHSDKVCEKSRTLTILVSSNRLNKDFIG